MIKRLGGRCDTLVAVDCSLATRMPLAGCSPEIWKEIGSQGSLDRLAQRPTGS
jgi:hypothetical protein